MVQRPLIVKNYPSKMGGMDISLLICIGGFDSNEFRRYFTVNYKFGGILVH